MNRDKRLKRKIAEVRQSLQPQIDAMLRLGESLFIIASFDIYEPGDIDEVFARNPTAVLITDPRQEKLDEIHGLLIQRLNAWAKAVKLLKDRESVCVDVLVRTSQTVSPGGEA